MRFPLLIAACTAIASLAMAAPALADPSLSIQAPARTEPEKPIAVVYSGFADAPGTVDITGTGQNMYLRSFYQAGAANCEPTSAAQKARSGSMFDGTSFIESPAPFSVTSNITFASKGTYRFCAYLEIGQTGDTSPPAAAAETVVQVGDPPPPCTVPALSGITLAAATKRLKSGGCTLGTVKKPKKPGKRTLVVKSQSKSSGTRLEAGAKINVVLKIKAAKKKK